jgi:hypothetical protein
VSGDLVRREEVGELVGRLSSAHVTRRERGRLLAQLGGLLSAGMRSAGAGAAVTGRWLTDVVAEAAPHIPVRDLATLRQHHDGLSGDALAEALVRQASVATAGIGAAGGAIATAQHAAPATLLLVPVQLAAETLAVVAIEVKLVAELHVVHGRAPGGTGSELAAGYLGAWALKRSLRPGARQPGIEIVLAAAAKQQLRRRVVRRLARNAATLAPLLVGAVAGAELNRRETVSLGEAIVKDLRRR